MVARACLYGVDRNPMAVDLAKLSLWLATLARNLPLTFLDHALQSGDSLVGLSEKQIGELHWDAGQRGLFAGEVRQALAQASDIRRRIRKTGDEGEAATLWRELQEKLTRIRLAGDLTISAFFDGAKAKERAERRRQMVRGITDGFADTQRERLRTLREDTDPPLAPFHWEIEFPEAFDRKNPGFDAFVGNPPFAGKNTVAAGNPDHYPDWLKQQHPGSHGNSDLVAHFFRRAYALLRKGGALGLIATNSIAQGDTRSTGLAWIRKNGGVIYDATRRYKWPGKAAVVVSVLHIVRGPIPSEVKLDGCPVDRITAFLFPAGSDEDPARLDANAGRSFVGSYVLGMGFTFDDTDRKGIASSLAEMERLIAKDPRNREVIFPYIGGEEVNKDPTHAHHRFVINFRDWPLRRAVIGGKGSPIPAARTFAAYREGDVAAEESHPFTASRNIGTAWRDANSRQRTLWLRSGVVPLDYPDPVAADWPDLLAIVERSVKPTRAHLTRNAIGRRRAEFWWRYGSLAKELYETAEGLDRVMVISRVTSHSSFAFVRARMVFSDALIVFPVPTFAGFAALQGRPHEIWFRFFASTLGDGLRYTPSDVFETFPFPEHWTSRNDLEAPGRVYHEHRARLMEENNEGLTKTYNRFHDPEEGDPGILRLRELHAEMDRAVLAAYGWTDIPTECDFFPLHPDETEDDEAPRKYRYRWTDSVHDDVLGRLMDLNAARAAVEAKARGVR